MPPTVTDTPASVELGQTASVTWHAPLAHSPYDYVTLAKVGSADNAYLSYQYVGNAGVASGTTITDTVSVSDTTPVDPNPANNSSSAGVQVAGSADLSVTN